MQTELTDRSAIDATLAELKEEMAVVEELIRKCIAQNAQDAQDQKEYDAHYDGLVNRYDAAKARLTALEKKKADRAAKAAAMGGFISELKERDEALMEFDDELWRATVEKATVMRDGRIVFTMKNGMEIEG